MTKFGLHDKVMIVKSERKGTVEGIAQYTKNPDQFLIEYINGVGDLVSLWFNEQDLELIQ